MAENTTQTVEISATAMEAAIRAGSFKLAATAKELGVSPEALKKMLVERWGDQLEFRKGRKGGVYFRADSTASETTSEVTERNEE